MSASFIVRFIAELRGNRPWFDSGDRLAQHLEWRLANPQGDGWDLVVSGDDTQDRLALAEWLDRCANAGPFLSPSWTRTFSEAAAWILRRQLPITMDTVLIASEARVDPTIDERLRRDGLAAVTSQCHARVADSARRRRERAAPQRQTEHD
jgi:hypothetical protein